MNMVFNVFATARRVKREGEAGYSVWKQTSTLSWKETASCRSDLPNHMAENRKLIFISLETWLILDNNVSIYFSLLRHRDISN